MESPAELPLLEVEDLRTSFVTPDGTVPAVDGVTFAISRGRTLALVGESGSGKSVTAYSLLRLIQPPGRILGGKILLRSARAGAIDLGQLDERSELLYRVRGGLISMIFQEPMTALSPVHAVGPQIAEAILLHQHTSRSEARRRTVEMLARVGLDAPDRRFDQYPHELSGGMRQRVVIAMALVCRPELLIADEPTTALDVTVQAQILELIKRLQRELGMAVIFITHDLGVVSGLCDRVQVMYAGRIVETADTRTLFRAPRHPYTQALQRSIPSLQAKGAELFTIPGLPPDLTQPLTGCAFAPRCAHATDRCRAETPRLAAVTATHAQACLRVQAGEL